MTKQLDALRRIETYILLRYGYRYDSAITEHTAHQLFKPGGQIYTRASVATISFTLTQLTTILSGADVTRPFRHTNEEVTNRYEQTTSIGIFAFASRK